MNHLSKPFVSIIIPVFNDAARLKTCLEALENQTYPKSFYKVIVVDNDSDEDINGVVSQFSQAFTTRESLPGSYAARNKGISIAKGEVIAFTDADCIPASNWIEKGVENLLRVPNCGLVAGKVELFFKNPSQPSAVELYDAIRMGIPQKRYIEESRYGATANLFTFSSVISKVGCFDDTLKSSGDSNWGQRVFDAGYKQIYAEDTCVAHPARDSLKQLYKKVIRITGGHQDVRRKKGYSLKNFARDIVKDFAPPIEFTLSIFVDRNLNNSKKIKVIFVRLLVKYVSGWERIRLQIGGKSTRG